LELSLVVGAASAASDAWPVPVLKCVALNDQGLPELVQALAGHRTWLGTPGGSRRRAARHQASAERLLFALVCERLAGALEPELKGAAARLAARELSPHAAADELFERVCAVAAQRELTETK